MELHDYQKRIANHIALHQHCILSVDMGLGKTAAVLAWMVWYVTKRNPNASGVIIAPKRVAENNWLQEAQKWGLVELVAKMIIVAQTPKKRALALKDNAHPIKIISRDNIKDVKDMRFDFVVFDELTSYKSITAKRTKAAMGIKADIRIGLTGTFLANGAIDIYAQAAVCGLGFGGLNFYGWRGQHFQDVLACSGLPFKKWKLNTPLPMLLQPIISNIFTLTAADYLRIPDVTETTHAIDMSAETRREINELDAFLSTTINGEPVTFDEKQKFAKLQTLCNGFVYDDTGEPVRSYRSDKLEQVADFVQDCAEQGESVLLFYAFREEERWLEELLHERGVRTDNAKNAGFIKRWESGDTDCLLAHPASAGHGLNLQFGGRIIVWSTLTYNYELFAQGNARLARQGQKRNVQIHYFVAARTCEVRAVKALQDKQKQQERFLSITKQ